MVKEEGSKEVKKLSRSLYHISAQNQLLHYRILGLKEVFKT